MSKKRNVFSSCNRAKVPQTSDKEKKIWISKYIQIEKLFMSKKKESVIYAKKLRSKFIPMTILPIHLISTRILKIKRSINTY